MLSPRLPIGLVGRFFPSNWRPPAEEIRFASQEHFSVIQVRNSHPGELEAELRAPLDEVADALARSGVEAALEMLLRVDGDGRTQSGDSAAAALARNLPAIATLGCRWVHLHLVLQDLRDAGDSSLEPKLLAHLAQAAALAKSEGFAFGIEHNPPYELLFADPEACARLLDETADIGFVWDVNHTPPEDLQAFERLLPRATLVHCSDTPLPETNHHLPLGLGTIDVRGRMAALRAAAFVGPVVLEIGGLPRSGGYGRDTDAALKDSRDRLLEAWAYSLSPEDSSESATGSRAGNPTTY